MESTREDVVLDRSQVKTAALALIAHLKSTSSSKKLIMSDGQPMSLLITLWKIPKKEQTIRIRLPNGLRTESAEVCLFTKDEAKMTSEQTERFYRKLLAERGVKNVTEVIPFKALKTEYKPFEAKRRLLGNFDLFLSDARIRRRLPGQIGKHFYEQKKAPLSVDLLSKHLAKDMELLIQGTTLTVSNKGCCCMARVAHSGMTADEIVENVLAAVSTISSKLEMKGTNIKIIHLKTQKSAALPIYSSDLSHITLVEESREKARLLKKVRKTENDNMEAPEDGIKQKGQDSEEEEIPQLVPIETPTKRPKRMDLPKKGLKKAPKPAAVKGLTKTMKDKKLAKKTPKVTARGLTSKARSK